MKEALQLRLIEYTDADKQRFSAFVAMTDKEFQKFKESLHKELTPFKKRIISVIPDATPSEDQRSAAEAAFAIRFGKRISGYTGASRGSPGPS